MPTLGRSLYLKAASYLLEVTTSGNHRSAAASSLPHPHMSSNKIHKLKGVFTANGGGCGCRPKPTDIIEPQPRPKSKSSFSDEKSSHLPSSSASSSDRVHGGDCTSSTFDAGSPHYRNDFSKIEDSVAVVKESDDPYQDFRESMLQMIIEREIYSRNDLQQLLDCYLKLNSPRHHQVIVQAFIEIWNGGGEDR